MKTSLILIFLCLSQIGKSQTAIDRIYLDFNGGARFLGNTSSATKATPGMHFDFGVGYQLNDIFALKGEVALDQFIAKDTSSDASFNYSSGIKYAYLYDQSTMIKLQLYGVLDIAKLASFSNEKFGLKTQFGLGVATNNNRDFKLNYSGSFSDPGIKGNDDMISAPSFTFELISPLATYLE